MQKLLFLALLLALACNHAPAQNAGGVHLIKKTVLGGEGGWDYLLADAPGRRLYVSHGNQVEVLDIDTHEKMGFIAGTKGVHGIAIAGKTGFVTCGRTNSVVVFEVKTLKKIAETPVGSNPDALLFDAFSNRVFVFNHSAGNVVALDAESGKALDSLMLGEGLEAGVSNGKGQIFVNVEDAGELVSFEAKTLKINGRWKLTPGEEPTGLAIDVEHKRLFSACGNHLMIVVDSETGKIVSQVPIGGRTDGAAFDAQNQLAFSSNGEGTLTVIKEISPTDFQVLETVKTEPGARTITLDEKTHHLFTSTAQFGEKPAPTADNPRPRAAILPGTFMVLEFGQ